MIRRIRKSLALKWMFFSILLTTVPLSLAGISILWIHQKHLKKSAIEMEAMKASMVIEKTEGFFDKITKDLLIQANNEDFNLGHYSSHVKTLLENFLTQNDYIWELTLLDESGKERIKVSKYKAMGPHNLKNQSKSKRFGVASGGHIYYGEFYLAKESVPAMGIAIPGKEYKGKPVGVLSAEIDLRYLSNLLIQIQNGKKGWIYVVDKEGNLIGHPDPKQVLTKLNVRHLPMVDQVVSGREGNLEYAYSEGEKVLCVYKPIKKLNWGVIAQIPIREAYAPLSQVIRVALGWVLVALAAATLLSLFLTKRFTLLMKRLSQEMRKVSRGDLNVCLPVTTKDEGGLLVKSFNQMIEDFKQSQEALKEAEQKYKRIFENLKDMVYMTTTDGKFIDVNQAGIEMLGYENKEELFKITVKDTYLNPEERQKFLNEINREGFVKDFETKLKRKDGTPIDTLITASLRRNEEGRILGYEGIIKDISLRKKIEDELVQRKEELQTLYDLSVLINQTLDLERILPIALEKALSFTGFEKGTVHLISRDEENLELKSDQGFSPAFLENVKVMKYGEGVAGKAITSRKPIIFPISQYPSQRILPFLRDEEVQLTVGIPLLAKGKAIGAITLSSRSIQSLTQKEINLLENIGNQIGLALENAKLFSNVAKAKSEWETTFDAVTDLITIRYKDYRIIRANKAAFKRFGLKPNQMVGKKCYEIFNHCHQPCEGCYVTQTLTTKKQVSGERESKYLNGIFQYYTFPIFDKEGEVVAVVDLAREITEEKRLEREREVVNNINKILASSLDVRQVVKAVHSELKRVLDSERMAIVLFDDRGGVRYSALEKGDEATPLATHTIYPREGTPFENMIDTGLPLIVPDIGKSNFWIEQKVLREGILSGLVFPLEYKGRIFGAMNFGSKESNHFTDHHIQFLRSIAPGIAISIQNAMLFEETRKRLDELTILYEVMKISASSLNLDKMLEEILSSLNNFFKFEALGILLVDENTKRLLPHPASYNELSMSSIGKLGLHVGKGITGWVAEEKEPLLVNDVRVDSRYVCGDERINSEMCVPLKVGEKVIGIIDAQSTTLNAFSEDDLRLFSIVGGQIATLIESIRLYEEIKQSEEKYRTVVESALDGVGVVAKDNRIKYANKRLAEIQGLPQEKVIGTNFIDFLDEESKQLMADRSFRRQQGEKLSPRFELNVVRGDGEVRNVEVNARVIKDSKEDINYIIFIKDVTEKRKMEEQLLQAEKLRALAEMASGVAHDFNNALASILGNAQLLLFTVEDEEAKESLRVIEKVAKDSAQTVRRLQDFTRKRVHHELIKVDINSIIKDSIEITKPKWKDEVQSRGIRVEVVSNLEDVPLVSGNASELREVITNLIFNAIEAMPQGGKIQVHTFKKGKEVFIQISDTGIGIAEEARKKIFEPFFTTKPFTNTGLGLSMSYGIIKRFGGEIEVKSKVGYGTTFTIILPSGGDGREEVISPSTLKTGRKARILVIDDEAFVRSVLARTLAEGNHQVTLAEDGEEGLQLFRKGKFDIVLTDWGMPGMSGWDVCRMIKKISPHTPVGMITGWGTEMSQSQMEEYGLDFFISKPFDFNHILNVVTETIESTSIGFLS